MMAPPSVTLDRHYGGVLKTETYFGFAPPPPRHLADAADTSDRLRWILAPMKLDRSLGEAAPVLPKPDLLESGRAKNHKCIFKIFKKGEGQEEKGKRRRRRRGGKMKMGKKYMMPVILGLLAAKSVLVPIALKALAFMSAKGLMMGFFSTVMASVLSLKGMFDNNHRYGDRKDEKTQVEVIQIPTPTKEDHYYSEVHDPYRRYDVVPSLPV